MKRLLSAIVVALVLWAQPASATIALVDHVAAGSTNNTSVTTGAMNSTGANLIVLITGSGASNVPTDSKSNVYTNVRTQLGNFSGHTDMWYCVTPTVGSGHTFSLSDSSPVIAAAAFSGAATVSTLDKQNGADLQGAASGQPGSITPGAANALVVTGIGAFMNAPAPTVTGYAVTDTIVGAGSQNWGVSLAYVVQGAATPTNPSWTTSGASFQYGAVVASFADGGGGPPPSTPCNLKLMGVGCDAP